MILIVAAVAVAAVAGGIWFVTEDPFDIFPGGSDVPAGGFVILNTYSIASRYFFQGLEFIRDGTD